MKKNVTMSDIAKELNVSTVTVSKAITNKEGVSEAVRQKIIKAAEEMGYVYHLGNKDETVSTHHNIGILVHERFMNTTGNSFYWKVYQNITSILKQNNSFGILEILEGEHTKESHIPKVVSESKVEGIILLGQVEEDYVELLYETGLPIILLDFYIQDAKYDSINSDSFYSSYMLTNHLIASGHKQIAFVGNIHATSSILDRYLGYCKSLIEHNLEIQNKYVLNDRDADGKYIDMVIPKDEVTAFVCNCDEVAYLLINKLKSEGIRVPEDVSVVGFDNYMLSTIMDPALTTVAVNVEEMAETAVKSILKKIKGNKKQLGRQIISSNIIYRDSVKNMI